MSMSPIDDWANALRTIGVIAAVPYRAPAASTPRIRNVLRLRFSTSILASSELILGLLFSLAGLDEERLDGFEDGLHVRALSKRPVRRRRLTREGVEYGRMATLDR